jgi:hypothetical protein
MLEKVGRSLQWLLTQAGYGNSLDKAEKNRTGRNNMKIIRKGPAMRVIFFYPGEEGTYVDHAEVILYENGIVHISSNQEETTTHLQNCEILWRFETDAEERANKVRLLKPMKSKGETRSADEIHAQAETKSESKPGKGNPSKSPEPRE